MGKKFKSKRKKRLSRLIILIAFLALLFYGFLLVLKGVIKNEDSEAYFKYLIKDSFNNQVDYNIFKIFNTVSEEVEKTNLDKLPTVYIYNTHDEEEYKSDYLNVYNINFNVKTASYYLQERLRTLGIESIVEETSIRSILRANNWVYKYSYQASRKLLEKAKNDYPSIKLFIDLHRDSSIREKTTVTVDDKTYAKVLFIVGLEHSNYEKNLNNVLKLNSILESKYPYLVRGIYKKSGEGVNGIYNQDFNEEVFLIEVGGQYNTIIEVSNTIDLLANIIYEYEGEL